MLVILLNLVLLLVAVYCTIMLLLFIITSIVYLYRILKEMLK